MLSNLMRKIFNFIVRHRLCCFVFHLDFINSMVSKNLKIENGTIIGADDFVKLYSAENEDAFAKEAPKKPAPQIVDSTGGQGLPKPADNSNQFSFNFRGVRPRENEK